LWRGDPLTPLVWDPLASKDLLDLELVSSNENKGTGLHQLFAIAPSCSTGLYRMFAPGSNGSVDTARKIVEFAEDHGWAVTQRNDYPGELSVRLEKAHGRRVMGARVSSGLSTDDSSVFVDLMWKWTG
jgi:hypothetical protein